MPMKCQKCARKASIHITEIIHGKPREYHLCEEHARAYLAEESSAGQQSSGSKAMTKLAESKVRSELDQLTCPVCGVTFGEFRSKGRFGCANDYETFQAELVPLLETIHGETEHIGRIPRSVPAGRCRHAELARLRQELKSAVAGENYEEAAKIRDKIRELEEAGEPQANEM